MMDMADRIQQLRKAKGISQEELADQIGVSRQAVSKWESGQSAPDIERVLLLCGYFETTADYLLRGIEPEQEAGRHSAVLPAIAGAVFNAVGLVFAVTVWIERRTAYAAGIGLALMLLGCGVFLCGQLLDFREKERARRLFLLPDVWTLLPIPAASCFNLLCGLRQGNFGELAPLPLLGNSLALYLLYWLCYFAVCIAVDALILRKMRG